MTEFTMDRLRENLEALKMKNTLEILDNYLERAVAENEDIMKLSKLDENQVGLEKTSVDLYELAFQIKRDLSMKSLEIGRAHV